MLGKDDKEIDQRSSAELYAAVATTFSESLATLARLIVAPDANQMISEGAAKAYEAVYKRMVYELDPDMGEMRGVTKH